jgi:hypothetical protein
VRCSSSSARATCRSNVIAIHHGPMAEPNTSIAADANN